MKVGPEDAECMAFLLELQEVAPEALPFLFHCANERKTNWQTGRKMKLMGVSAGVPDYFLAIPIGDFHGLWIEMKRTDTGTPSAEQRAWLGRLDTQGYCATISYGFRDAIHILTDYLAGTGVSCPGRTRRDARAAGTLGAAVLPRGGSRKRPDRAKGPSPGTD